MHIRGNIYHFGGKYALLAASQFVFILPLPMSKFLFGDFLLAAHGNSPCGLLKVPRPGHPARRR
jgi:hypothetical protein